ncbi:MAG: class I SAM-dependent methyltransferase [Chloroflexota bacterium]|nr:class I SAM-dependent methyltransferase [Chloroflexota bacterium]MDE3193180.1 class I SAM-dependent methyltransferase [Chloroflexota bacterium]
MTPADPLAHLGLRDPARFLAAYRAAFGSIHGAFTIDAALLFFMYGGLLAEADVRGATCEIGVHQGLSAIAVAALRGEGALFYGIDTFGAPRDIEASGGMSGDDRAFRANMSRFYADTSFVRVIAADSRTVAPSRVEGCSFFHVDGGHSADETKSDLALAAEATVEGGLVALDDYFNPSFPGVSEGAVRFLAERRGALVPLAVGHNKVIFQRAPPTGDLNARVAERYARLPHTRAVFDGAEVLVFGSAVAPHVDLDRSTPARLVTRDVTLRAEIRPRVRLLEAAPGAVVDLPLRMWNRSDIPFAWSDAPFGLSYQLYRADESVERYENARLWFFPPLDPGVDREMVVPVVAPERPGDYVVAVDVVWEGICWLRERGSAVPRVPLRVE